MRLACRRNRAPASRKRDSKALYSVHFNFHIRPRFESTIFFKKITLILIKFKDKNISFQSLADRLKKSEYLSANQVP